MLSPSKERVAASVNTHAADTSAPTHVHGALVKFQEKEEDNAAMKGSLRSSAEQANNMQQRIAYLEERNRELESAATELAARHARVVADLEAEAAARAAAGDTAPILSFKRIAQDPKLAAKIPELTGFTSAEAFLAFWDLLNHDGAAARMRTWQGSQTIAADKNPDRVRGAAGRPNRQGEDSRENNFFYWWFKLYTGCHHTVASILFGLEHSTATKSFVSMTLFQFYFLKEEFPQPTRAQIDACMPPGWEVVYGTSKMREIFDATELFIESPSCNEANRACYSDYKSHCTIKILVGISPCGAATFVSDAYPGKISDVEQVRACDYCKRGETGDKFAADRGFEQVKHDLAAVGADLIAPTMRFRGQSHLTTDEAEDTSSQANNHAYSRGTCHIGT